MALLPALTKDDVLADGKCFFFFSYYFAYPFSTVSGSLWTNELATESQAKVAMTKRRRPTETSRCALKKNRPVKIRGKQKPNICCFYSLSFLYSDD